MFLNLQFYCIRSIYEATSVVLICNYKPVSLLLMRHWTMMADLNHFICLNPSSGKHSLTTIRNISGNTPGIS